MLIRADLCDPWVISRLIAYFCGTGSGAGAGSIAEGCACGAGIASGATFSTIRFGMYPCVDRCWPKLCE